MKVCTKCKELKGLEFFYKDKRKKDGKHSSCKKCENKATKNSYIINRDLILKKLK